LSKRRDLFHQQSRLGCSDDEPVGNEQFNITPKGITHKPTDAGFTPYPARPFAGTMHMGQPGSQLPNGDEYRPEDVKKVMQTLCKEYVAENVVLFK
jgi:hypothetical protein